MTITAAVRRAARINGRGDAIRTPGCRRTWSEFVDRVARLAGGLAAAGIRPGDRVALLANNSPGQLELNYAVFWAGAVLVPLNYRLAQAELAQVLEQSSPRLLFLERCHERLLGDRLAGSGCGIVQHGEAEPDYQRFLAAAPLADRSGEAPDGLAGLYFTGGTTGRPKGVMLRHDSLMVQGLEMLRMLGTTSDKVALHALPLFHMGGTSVAHGVTMGAGVHSFIPSFDPGGCLEIIASCGITHLSLVPTMMAMLLDHAVATGRMDVATRLELLCYGAAPMPPPLLERMIRELPATGLRQFYGMTELCGACVTLDPEDHRADATGHLKRRGSAGRVVPSTEIEVHAADGSACPVGVAGEVVARGPLVMSGYWQDPESTAAVFHDGWLHTGDIGVLDDDGYLTILDRLKDMIISGGENIYTAEVEAILSTHDKVRQCAVIGVPDGRWGEVVHAVVVIDDGDIDPERFSADLLEFCRARLAGYKCPRSYSFRTESMPLSGVGKVKKDVLRAEVLERVSVQMP